MRFIFKVKERIFITDSFYEYISCKHINTHSHDFGIIKTSDERYLYNFVSTIDDIDMKVTHIIRGNDHLSNTTKQMQIFSYFNYTPQFCHLPLIHGDDGKPLSKRNGTATVKELLSEGYNPKAILNYLALLGWSPSGKSEQANREIFSLDELIQYFNMLRVKKSPAKFSKHKLNWFQKQYESV